MVVVAGHRRFRRVYEELCFAAIAVGDTPLVLEFDAVGFVFHHMQIAWAVLEEGRRMDEVHGAAGKSEVGTRFR